MQKPNGRHLGGQEMYKVIVVDDEALIREGICRKMDWGQIGYELAGRFENGQKAKEFLEQNPVDVVLTDICMPHMDGMELSEYIHINMPDVKVVIFSGFDDFEYAKKAIHFQVEEYLLKPVTAVELSELLVKLRMKIDEERKEKEKNQELSRVVNKNKIYLQSRALYKLLIGDSPIGECIKELEENGIFLGEKNFYIAVLHMQEKGEKNQSALFQFIVYNMVLEIVAGRKLGYVGFGYESSIFILFDSMEYEGEVFTNEVSVCLEEIRSIILEKMQMGIDIGVGRMVFSADEINISYQSALDSLESVYTVGTGKILWSEEMEAARERELEMSCEISQLVNAVRENRQKQITECIACIKKKISDRCVKKTKVSVYLQICAKALYQLAERCPGGVNQVSLLQEEKVLLQIEQASCLEESSGVVENLARQLAKAYEMETGGEQNRIVMQAMEYICENYGRAELTLTEICTHFGVSVSRFSVNFKNRYDETFTEALTRIRMEQAKKLLSSTDLKNYEIAERVGFTDPHYFSIAFKKATGKTPTEWGREHAQT